MNRNQHHHLDRTDRPGSLRPDGPRHSGQAGAVATGRRIPPKLYRIGEVVEYSGVSRQTIHNYTTMGLIHESDRTRGNHRLYGEEVFERLDRIAAFKAERKSMDFIRAFFADRDGQEETSQSDVHPNH